MKKHEPHGLGPLASSNRTRILSPGQLDGLSEEKQRKGQTQVMADDGGTEMTDEKVKAKKKKAKKAKLNPDDLLLLDGEMQQMAIDEAEADSELDAEDLAEQQEVKSFSTEAKLLAGIKCPTCNSEQVYLSNAAGMLCAVCLQVPVLSIEGKEMELDEPQTTFEHIVDDLVTEWVDLFTIRHGDYGNGASILGTAGQYSDMNRKMTKLKRALWDGQELNGEQPREILFDLIGHCFLTIDMLDADEQME